MFGILPKIFKKLPKENTREKSLNLGRSCLLLGEVVCCWAYFLLLKMPNERKINNKFILLGNV
jgi:hypothetical protein